ncbi:hypothetical protein EYR41_004884 [Orbilia oligospora]|uniref:Cation chloride cotransporter n=1 Tax=Orbilia oligospora TaxID=2813651 RepID=A0A8H2E3J9_ORBOL|nr:hypothetical protein EYR41_004884 [Orbilia oligospora]
MAAAGRYVSQLLGDATEVLTRRGSVPSDREQQNTYFSGWFSGRRKSGDATSHLPRMTKSITNAEETRAKSKPKSNKLGTFNGVFVPTTLNVLSILMFLRFGFILGQSGVLGMMGMLGASYLINLVTTLSISAISTNGTVRGGGAYYLISRSLGPEFGGSIGIVFYLGYVLNTGMNAVGLVDCIMNNYGIRAEDGTGALPDSFGWRYLYATGILILCTTICLLGSSIFAKASNLLLVILLAATYSIPISTLFMKPMYGDHGLSYTGLSWDTFRENLLPQFTRGAAGSESHQKENFQSLFGILFPATGGIFAGASMSGDLRKPNKSIPKGTLHGLLLTFITYTFVVFSMGASIKRTALYTNLNIIQDVNVSAVLIFAGEFATSFFSALLGVVGSAKLLQALARDNLIPGFGFFAQGTASTDEPIVAIIFTFLVAQLTLLANINQIASFVTMTYLLTFLAINLACFLLKVSAAPNFRPSFNYFRWWTAAIGTVISGITMFFVDGVYASVCVLLLLFLFLLIHYTSPPKAWGDVSQSLIYHQVRKYLLRLKQENHIKFWRPQLLLFVNDPRRSYKLIQFCNSLKKGGLYILAHVIVTPDFRESFPEAKKQQQAWMKYIDFGKCKAFVQIAISPTIEWGMRNIVLGAGLGGMRPNIAIMGMYNLDEYQKRRPLIELPVPDAAAKDDIDDTNETRGQLPTDTCRIEQAISVTSWVNMLEDMLMSLQINVALAKGFKHLQIPKAGENPKKKYIDLWPIQMSAQIPSEGGTTSASNFDTYTLILQLGCILHTVPAWKKVYTIRVIVFVEYESDVEEEAGRVKSLLDNLRIKAEVVVCWLAKGDLKTYETIVNGKREKNEQVEEVIGGQEWWIELQRRRREAEHLQSEEVLNSQVADLLRSEQWPSGTFMQQGTAVPGTKSQRFLDGVKKFVKGKRRGRSRSVTRLQGLDVSLGTMNMTTHSLQPHVLSETESESDSSDSESDSSSSTESAVSLNDVEDYDDEDEEEEGLESRRRISGRRPNKFERSDPASRRVSIGGGVLLSAQEIARFDAKRKSTGRKSKGLPPVPSRAGPSGARTPDRTSLRPPIDPPDTSSSSLAAGPNSASTTAIDRLTPASAIAPSKRPGLTQRTMSSSAFSSQKIPHAQVNEHEDSGPTIMFADQEPPSHKRASGYPAGQDVSLSFNDLPSLAQYLILNELMRKFSDDTAVVFTTLPSPLEGTYKSEEACVEYISGLDVLCEKLPPVLLIHSNSMTVTMAL